MILLALSLLLFGAFLSRWMKVLVLLPATLLAWGVALSLAGLQSLSLLQAVVDAFLAGFCLQFGYFAGGLFLGPRTAHAKKHAFSPIRR